MAIQNIENSMFNVIWKAKAPQRLKAFMWLAANDALLPNCAWLKRGLAINDSSVLCGVATEITLHALRGCPKAKELWKSIEISFIEDSFFK